MWLCVAAILAGACDAAGAEVIATPERIDQTISAAALDARVDELADELVDAPPAMRADADAPVSPPRLGVYFWCMLALGVIGAAAFFIGRWRRLPSQPPVDGVTAFTRLSLFFLMLIASWVGVLIGAALTGIDLGSAPEHSLELADEARLGLGVAAAQSVVVAVYVVMLGRNVPPYQKPRTTILHAAMIGLGALMLAWPLVGIVGMLGGWLRRDADPLAHETLRRLTEPHDPQWLAFMAVIVIVLVPILEEVSYRGLLQRSLRQSRLGPWAAIALASLFFALMHWGNSEPQAIAALLVLSLALGWAYEKSGRLIAPIVMHIVFNLANLVLAMWLVR